MELLPGEGYDLPFPGIQTAKDFEVFETVLREMNIPYQLNTVVIFENHPGLLGHILEHNGGRLIDYSDESGCGVYRVDIENFEKIVADFY